MKEPNPRQIAWRQPNCIEFIVFVPLPSETGRSSARGTAIEFFHAAGNLRRMTQARNALMFMMLLLLMYVKARPAP